jgi:PAS domain S-box-containing protein
MLRLNAFSDTRRFFRVVLPITIVAIILIYIISLSVSNNHFSFENLGQIHTSNPLIWVIYGIAGVFLRIAKKYSKCQEEKYQLQQGNIQVKEMEQKALNFAKELETGNLDVNYHFEKDNQIGDVLINLRNKLKQNQEEEQKRQQEDEQRNWISDGLAKFNDILRQDKGNDIYKLSYDIISNLVRYLGANQGGLFIINEAEEQKQEEENDKDNNADKYFELTAAYAFDRRKYHTKRIEWGEGLVGACALEKESIYITEIPQDYINITSGLGDANPTALLIVPLKLEEEVHGVIEIASFNEIAKYQRDFVERIGESVASTISSIKINNRTNELLRKSQQQAEELASQEEELRQNMEEMKATQESLEQSQAKTKMIFENAMDAIITIDENGYIDQFNPSAEQLFGYKAEEVQGNNVSMLMPQKHASQHDGYLNRYLQTGEKHILGETREEEGITKDGKTFPVELRVDEAWLDNKRMFVGMLKDITERKKAEQELQQQMEEVRSQDEELKQNIEELQTTQEQLKEKDEQQRREIEKLNAENEKKLEKIKEMAEEQKKKDEETKKLYEGEIDLMFDTWIKHLKIAEKKLNQNNQE